MAIMQNFQQHNQRLQGSVIYIWQIIKEIFRLCLCHCKTNKNYILLDIVASYFKDNNAQTDYGNMLAYGIRCSTFLWCKVIKQGQHKHPI
jgi:hypothetical protein